MGGEIGCVSEVGVGTEFFIILDIVRSYFQIGVVYDLGVEFDWICRGGREYGRSVVLDGEKTETAKGSSGLRQGSDSAPGYGTVG